MVLERGALRFNGVPAQLMEQLNSNCFEFSCFAASRAVEAAVGRLAGETGLQRVGSNYMLTVGLDVNLEQVVSLFGEAAIELIHIRNISASTRRLFTRDEH